MFWLKPKTSNKKILKSKTNKRDKFYKRIYAFVDFQGETRRERMNGEVGEGYSLSSLVFYLLFEDDDER